MTSLKISLRTWFFTAVIVACGIQLIAALIFNEWEIEFSGIVFLCVFIGSLPAAFILWASLWLINRIGARGRTKFLWLLISQLCINACYAFIATVVDIFPLSINSDWIIIVRTFCLALAGLTTASAIASLLSLRMIADYFSFNAGNNSTNHLALKHLFQHTPKNKIAMETTHYDNRPSQSNLLVKGLITGGLILLMLIPTIFIANLIEEREVRQKEVVKEVSSKWSNAQVISAPYLVVPYHENGTNADGKAVIIKRQLVVLANTLDVNGQLFPENRPRSIYKVLLYKSNLHLKGTIKPVWPQDINTANLDLANARLCFGLSDFKGIEEDIFINFNGQKISLAPGLPNGDADNIGLSAPVQLSMENMLAGLDFDMNVKIKGSGQLHFMPISATSRFTLRSAWPDPSFDGNVLPNERNVSEKGFSATWNFNQANLPFGTVTQASAISKSALAFGVSMIQPADHYNKTMRSVKYAILFIGLTFALFFIIEIMQKKPFHPVQYVLVGLALVIFYTLLLSISEYILFDRAYLIAAMATVSLITLYAKGHFRSWTTSLVFCGVLSSLYGFIFILIRLEDTALIVGSIGLFLVLALVMYVSRKINWYGATNVAEYTQTQQ